MPHEREPSAPTLMPSLEPFQMLWSDDVVTSSAADFPSRLRQHGLRVTAPRVAVLEALNSVPHASADVVQSSVRERIGSVSTQAVYDVLAAFERAGLVRRIEPAGHPARFETRVHDNHHHLVCRGCGRIDDVDCAVGTAPCLDASAALGFVVDEAELTFWGLCPACAS